MEESKNIMGSVKEEKKKGKKPRHGRWFCLIIFTIVAVVVYFDIERSKKDNEEWKKRNFTKEARENVIDFSKERSGMPITKIGIKDVNLKVDFVLRSGQVVLRNRNDFAWTSESTSIGMGIKIVINGTFEFLHKVTIEPGQKIVIPANRFVIGEFPETNRKRITRIDDLYIFCKEGIFTYPTRYYQ